MAESGQLVARLRYKEALAKRGFSVRRFAASSGRPRPTLVRYNRATNIKTDTIAAMAEDITRVTGVPCHPDELLEWLTPEQAAARMEGPDDDAGEADQG